jgi:predicted protein tyrosine phosphatase
VTIRALFVCSQNRLRSPTAEQVFSSVPGLEVDSAGLNHDAETPLTPEQVAWADVVFVMEKTHRNKLSKGFRAQLKGKKIVCLNIPDEYEYMDAGLIRLLKARVPPHLPAIFSNNVGRL